MRSNARRLFCEMARRIGYKERDETDRAVSLAGVRRTDDRCGDRSEEGEREVSLQRLGELSAV